MVLPFNSATRNAKLLPVAYRDNGLDARPGTLKPFILESHARCEYLGLKTHESCDYSALMAADFQIALERNARLIVQASSVLTMLGKSVADFGSMIVLTDGTGTILRTQCQSTFIEQAEKVALRPGVSWADPGLEPVPGSRPLPLTQYVTMVGLRNVDWSAIPAGRWEALGKPADADCVQGRA